MEVWEEVYTPRESAGPFTALSAAGGLRPAVDRGFATDPHPNFGQPLQRRRHRSTKAEQGDWIVGKDTSSGTDQLFLAVKKLMVYLTRIRYKCTVSKE